MPVTAGLKLCRLVVPVGLVRYSDGYVLQESYVNEVSAGGPERLILLEHSHVITLGRGFHKENLLFSSSWLAERGVDVEESGRGGDVTYHGPGQLVGYPILNLAEQPDLHLYLRHLEELMIRVLKDFGIESDRKAGLTGVWVGDEKAGAIGVRVSRWITSHGFALNVNTDLKYFQYIVPCGIRQHGVTSIQKILGKEIPMEDVRRSITRRFEEIFQRKVEA